MSFSECMLDIHLQFIHILAEAAIRQLLPAVALNMYPYLFFFFTVTTPTIRATAATITTTIPFTIVLPPYVFDCNYNIMLVFLFPVSLLFV